MSIDIRKLIAMLIAAPALVLAMWLSGSYLVNAFSAYPDPEFFNRDFANYWIAGRLVLDGNVLDLFGPQPDYFSHMKAAFGPDYPWHAWSYPPHYLFFVFWTGYLPYHVAVIVFLALTLVFLFVSMRALTGKVDLMALAIFLPLIAHNIWAGQNGFLTGALAIGALAYRDKRPVLAGILLGMLTIKPHLGILFPFLMLAERRWKVIAAAGVTTVALFALSVMMFGWQSWDGYIANIIPYQKMVMMEAQGVFVPMIASLFGSLRNLQVDSDIALMAHMAFAVPVFLASVWVFFRTKDMELRAVLLLLSTVLVSPYIISYDLALMSAALVILVRRFETEQGLVLLCLISASLPMVMIPLGQSMLPIAPLLLAAVALSTMVNSPGGRRVMAVTG